jgi:hypothetical protein
MPTLTEDNRHALLVYLNVEGFRAGAMTQLDNDIVDLLNDNGYAVPSYQTGAGAGNPMFGGNKQYSKHVQQHWSDANIQNWMGLADEQEADNYTRHIVAPPASTGSSRSAKRNGAGDPLPARVLKPEFFDHNGMMSINILSIASTGKPDPTWIAAAKKVAAGANYLSEFPANLRDTYALGSRGIHPVMGATTPTPPPAPAPTPTPVTPAIPTPVATPVEEEETVPEEVVEEVVVEEVAPPTGTTYFSGDATAPLGVVVPTARSLNDATWAGRDAYGGMYPYEGQLRVVLSQSPNNAALQPPVTAKNLVIDLFGGDEGAEVVEVDASPSAHIDFNGSQIYLTVGSNTYLIGSYDRLEVAWERGTAMVNGLVASTNGDEIIKISANKILSMQPFTAGEDSLITLFDMADAPANFWVSPEILYDVSELDGTETVYIGPVRDDVFGIGGPASARDDYNEALNNLRAAGFGFGYYDPNVTIAASLEGYEGGLTDLDGTMREENYWLSRIVAATSDAVDVSQTYIAVNLVFDMDTSTTTDLFNGGPEKTKMETLIFPGDEQELDLLLTPYGDEKTVMAELKIDSEGLRALMLQDLTTSPAIPAVDEDGNALGYNLVTDVDIEFGNMATGDSTSIHIPNPDDEFAAVDLLGETLRGRVESIELRTGDPSGAYQKQKAIRRQQRMSDAFNIRNGSKSDENATAAVAFSKDNKYYILGRHDGKPIMVELQLDF